MKSLEQICDDLTLKKNIAFNEREEAQREAAQFREDVDFLTLETSKLLEDYNSEKARRRDAEAKQDKQQAQLEEMKHLIEMMKQRETQMQEETFSFRSLVDNIQKEKQELAHRLNSQRDEYKSAFLDLQQIKKVQDERMASNVAKVE